MQFNKTTSNINWQIFRQVTFLFLSFRGVFFLLNFVTLNFGGVNNTGKYYHFFPESQWLDSFFRWDSGWYNSIVERGYSFVSSGESNVAFFPLYPSLVKILSVSTGINQGIAGLIISNVSFLLALFFTYKIASLYLNEESTRKAIMLILVYPASFFFSSFYTEGVFFLTISASFYYYLKERYLYSGIWGLFACLTRLPGIFLFISFSIDLLIRAYQNKKINKSALFLFLIPCGLFSYMYFLYVRFGNPLAFYTVQKAWKRDSNDFFINTIFKGLSNLDFLNTMKPISAMVFLNCLVSLLAFLLLMFCYKKARLNLSLIVFSFLSLVIPLSTGSSESMARFIAPLFPLFILLGYICQNNSIFLPVMFTFTYLQAAIFLWFAHWGWVT